MGRRTVSVSRDLSVAASEGKGATLRIMESNAPCLYTAENGARCYNDVVTGKGYCKGHLKPFEFNTYGEGLPKNWRTIHAAVLRRDKGVCYLCGSATPLADGVEHVKPRALGGSDKMFNLRAVHDKVAPYCHRAKTAADANEIKRQNNTAKRRGLNR